MAKQLEKSSTGEIRTKLAAQASALGEAVVDFFHRFHSTESHSKHVQITPHESSVVPGKILWEEWRVAPEAIAPNNEGRLVIQGHPDQDLWQGPFSPLDPQVVLDARAEGRHLIFQAHPKASGLFLETVA